MVGINSNLIAGSATRNLGAANSVVSGSVARLSSGNRIIKASDDVAGLAIGTSIQSTVKTLEIALLNTQQANSVLSIADGALQQIGDILTRQNSLASQANSGSLGSTERGFLNQEFQALVSEIDRIVASTQFNGITLLNGSLGSSAGLDVSSAAGDNTYAYTGTVGSSALDGSTFTILNTSDNLDLIGSTSGIEVTGLNAGAADGTQAVFTLTLNGQTYTSGNVNVTVANTDRTITFTEQTTGHTIAVSLDVYSASTTQADVETIAAAIEEDLNGLTIYQRREFGTATGGIPTDNTAGTILAGLSGADVILSSTAFDTTNNTAPVVGAFNVTAATGTTDFSVSTTIGGATYSTTTTTNGVVDTDGGTDIEALDLDDAGTRTGVLRLYLDGDATTNPQNYIDIDLATNNTYDGIDVSSLENAAQLESALNSLFGVGNNGALSFQVGANVTDSISVSISSALTTDIYEDDDGTVQVLDITTQAGAQEAIEVVGNAISTIIGRRADVGAAISRFNFAASNLEVSISNQDAARGSFLDADIATESTAFATAQVKLQASVAVLAQANALPRTLLSLLQ